MRMKTNVMIVVCLLVASLLDVVVTTGTLEQLSGKRQRGFPLLP